MWDTNNWKNKLYYGDNLKTLRDLIPSESVDLIYLDPPFNSNATYNVLFKETDGERSNAQITAFEDTWHWDTNAELTYREIVQGSSRKLSDLMQAMNTFLGHNDMLAYLTMMAIRLVELRRVLKNTGSIYLHCDPTASHYIKLLMDAVFGVENFRNEIVWKRTSAKGNTYSNFPKNHDIIFRYTKTNMFVWNSQYTKHDPQYIKNFYKFTDENGRLYRLDNLANPNINRPNLKYEFLGVTRVWRWTKDRMQKAFEDGLVIQSKPGTVPCFKRYLDEQEGNSIDDIWTDLIAIQSQSNERLGYPTQKPEALLERIIKASSNEGDLVLDPFCGCGTTIAVAERLNRHWIGMDITHLAINLMKRRLKDTFASELKPFEVHGDPKDVSGALELFHQDPFQFEWWAVDMVDAVPGGDKKKGSDRGIDGFINFFDDDSSIAKRIIVQVKGGKIDVKYIRDLVGVLDREKAQIGVLVSLEKTTSHMEREAKDAGFYESPNGRLYPRIQMLTIEEIFSGKKIDYPFRDSGGFSTYKKAQKKINNTNPEEDPSLQRLKSQKHNI